jgi:phosphatidylserine decarboxylase precursor-related protein
MPIKFSPELWLRSFSPLVLPILLTACLLAFILALLSDVLALLMAGMIIVMILAYCDPPRAVPADDRVALSPLDGMITAINSGRGLPLCFDQAKDQTEHFTSITMQQSLFGGRTVRAPITGTIIEIVNTDIQTGDNEKPSWARGDDIAILLRDEQGVESALLLHGYYIPHQIRLSIETGAKIIAGDRLGIILGLGHAELLILHTIDTLARTTTQHIIAGETILAGSSGSTNVRTV